MSYPFRFPFALFFAKLGFALSINIDVFYDEKANVFIAFSEDLFGLNLEAGTLDQLQNEIKEAVPNLLASTSKINLQIYLKGVI